MSCFWNGVRAFVGQFIYNPPYWTDLRVPSTSTVTGSANPPTYKQWGMSAGVDAVYAWHFSPTIQEDLFFSAQFPHSLKLNTDWSPHVHWSPSDNTAGNVVWRLSWRWANIGDVFPAVQGSSVIAPSSGSVSTHQYNDFPVITATNSNISAMVVGRISRLGNNASDTYTGEAVFHEVDFHFLLDTPGSRQEDAK